MDIIIFSKDRSMQLDLCLRSIKDHVKIDHNVKVLYDYSNNLSYSNYYHQIMLENYGAEFILQEKLYKTLKRVIKESDSKYFILMVDDSIFVNDDFVLVLIGLL